MTEIVPESSRNRTGPVFCIVVETVITIDGEPVTCVCGATSRWMIVHDQTRVAIGCVCGRLWWEPRITPTHLAPYDSNLTAEFPNINHAAASNGFGPFMVV
ncbi:hypothetical protein [Streptomyces sp. NRRL S-241]|uniref:hypothetical protein n=1 Tax=Streptomyces sp. NRRL S-241 TaxID=1463896 RepID=UPI0004C1723F|nr:hypothetical protein [Streptomyces sp. NRRL S-241]